jgi:uncharacterized protein
VAFQNPSPDQLRALIAGARTVAVVGLSPDPDRPSYSVATYLQAQGYRIVPVRPGGGTLLGERVYQTLEEIPFAVDIVDIFRASRFVAAHVEEALRIGARAIWMQEGVIDEAAAERARAAGATVVMDRCLVKEHRKSGVGPIA